MTEISLVIPPLFKDRDIKESVFYIPHIGIGYIASYLQKMGIDVNVIDAQAENISFEVVKKNIEKSDSRIVGISAPTSQMNEAAYLAKLIKEINKNIITVIGGWHATALPKETIKNYPQFDYVVYGEGEITFYELVKGILNKGKMLNVNGILYRQKDKIIQTKERTLIEYLDLLPFPDWSLFPLKKYKPMFSFSEKGIVELPISTSRGCPYSCIFCSRVSGKTLRTRSTKNVIKEIKRNYKTFGSERFVLTDETFTINRNRTKEFCDMMIQSGLNKYISWMCETRVDCVDKDLLLLLKKAGCTHILYGVESGNERILKIIKKNITIKQIKDAFKWTREVDIKSYASFILGHPYETEDTIEDTINLAMDLDPEYVSFNILVPFPKTEVERMAKQKKGNLKIITENWGEYVKQIGGSLELRNLPRSNLEGLQAKAYMKFYLRPSKIHNLFDIIRDKKIIYHYAKHNLRFIV